MIPKEHLEQAPAFLKKVFMAWGKEDIHAYVIGKRGFHLSEPSMSCRIVLPELKEMV